MIYCVFLLPTERILKGSPPPTKVCLNSNMCCKEMLVLQSCTAASSHLHRWPVWRYRTVLKVTGFRMVNLSAPKHFREESPSSDKDVPIDTTWISANIWVEEFFKWGSLRSYFEGTSSHFYSSGISQSKLSDAARGCVSAAEQSGDVSTSWRSACSSSNQQPLPRSRWASGPQPFQNKPLWWLRVSQHRTT